jgi:hypothetical protein
MGKIRDNGYTVEFSGRVGRHVFRRMRDGSMIAAIRPDRTRMVPHGGQIQANEDFRKAVAYAKQALADPAKADVYRARAAGGSLTPFNVAVADWFKLPGIQLIDVANYHGHAGEQIRLVAYDDIAVAAVTLEVRTVAGTLIEQGSAAKVGADWIYTGTTTLPAGQPVNLVATATDLPGHGTSETKLYP